MRIAEAVTPDLVLLDIAMPGMDGIDVARALSESDGRSGGRIRHRLRQFRGRRVRRRRDRLSDEAGRARPAERALDRVRAHMAGDRPPPASLPPPMSRNSGCPTISGLVRISASDIHRVTAERDYMRLHVGTRSWLIHRTIAKLEEDLDPALFLRVHRSVILQARHDHRPLPRRGRPLDRAPHRRRRAAHRPLLRRRGQALRGALIPPRDGEVAARSADGGGSSFHPASVRILHHAAPRRVPSPAPGRNKGEATVGHRRLPMERCCLGGLTRAARLTDSHHEAARFGECMRRRPAAFALRTCAAASTDTRHRPRGSTKAGSAAAGAGQFTLR